MNTELPEVSSQAKASMEFRSQLQFQKHKLDEQQIQGAINTANSEVGDLVKSNLVFPLSIPVQHVFLNRAWLTNKNRA